MSLLSYISICGLKGACQFWFEIAVWFVHLARSAIRQEFFKATIFNIVIAQKLRSVFNLHREFNPLYFTQAEWLSRALLQRFFSFRVHF